MWLIFAIIQSVCWCSRIPWMEGGKPISISASLLFCLFRFGAAGHSSVHAKGLPVLCLPIPNFSREIDLLFDCPREGGSAEEANLLSPSLFEIFKSAADQTIPFANVHLVKWDGLGMALSSKFQPNPSFMMFETGT